MVNISTRLHVVTRIHYALMRQLGQGIDLRAMLDDPAEAREVLWVCDALGDPDLSALAARFRRTEVEACSSGQAGSAEAPQELAWSKDTSGFGLSQPFDMSKQSTAVVPPSPLWHGAMKWLRRAVHDER